MHFDKSINKISQSKSQRPKPGGFRRRRWLALEALESRIVLDSTWGGVTSGSWQVATNWQSGTLPVPGDTLTFPSGASNLTNTNDLAAGVAYNALNIGGGGYLIGGASIALAGNVTANQATGSSEVDLPIAFTGSGPTAEVSAAGTTLVLGGVLSGTSTLAKTGAGELDLSANDSLVAVTVSAGTLRVVGSTGQAGAIAVGTGTTFGGTGTVASIASTSGTINPGTSSTPGVLTDNGAFTLDSGSTFQSALNTTSVFGEVSAAGAVTLGGATLSLSLGSGFAPPVGTSFTLISNQSGASVSGTFAGHAEGSVITISGLNFTISYQGGTSGHDVVLTRAAVTSATALSASPANPAFGQQVTLTATVTGGGTVTPTGTVTFMNGSNQLGTGTLNASGVATFSTSSLPLGANTITADYGGDTNFAASTSPSTTVTVGQSASTTTLTSSLNPAFASQTVTLTAAITASGSGSGTPTGTVRFLDGTTVLGTATLSSGSATFSTSTLIVGVHPISADYLGDANFQASASTVTNVAVNVVPTTTAISASSANPGPGQSVTLTASVTPGVTSSTVTGSVRFFANGLLLGSGVLAGGKAIFTTTALPLGPDTLTAQYLGDANNGSSVSGGLAVAVGSANEQLVNSVYVTVLHRSADAAGLAFWTNILNQAKPFQDVVRSIVGSSEAETAAVSAAFLTYLAIDPTAQQVKTALAVKAATGVSPTLQVLGSKAYFDNSGGTDSAFLDQLALDVTGASFSKAQKSAFASQLASGTSRQTVALEALSGVASRTFVVQGLYGAILGRNADTAGQNAFVSTLLAGNPVQKVIISMLSSSEYQSFY